MGIDPADLPLLALAGPTASGKSALAMALAARWPLEIISVDSALVYRGMDIGTAKPTLAERAAVPHHLIDLLDPTQAYSAARFVADAQRVADEVRARGRVPLLVGGTLLYLKALMDGLNAMPSASPALRAELDAQAAALGWPALHAELARVDPATAARLPPHDAQRIQRALEVWRASGITLSQWHAQARSAGTPVTLVALEPTSRAWLHERITQRFHAMLAAGFLDEVKGLRARGDLQAGLPSMRCVGYRQAWEALDANDLSDLPERGIAATRQLAKRQLTWLRGLPRQVLACDDAQLLTRALDLLGPLLDAQARLQANLRVTLQAGL